MADQFKSSQFNEYLGNLGDKWVVANHLTGGMIEVSEDMYRVLLNNEIHQIEKKETIQSLQHGKFVVADNFDEVEGLRKMKREWSESAKAIGLEIVPTLACNFNCSYCYENQREDRVVMSTEVMDGIIDFVQRTIKPSTQVLLVSWFGGEPLLAIKQIELLSKRFLELAAARKIQFRAFLVTNGYLLTQKNVDILVQSNVKDIQVTLDGPKEVHDQRRTLLNGNGTWQTIVDNLKYALEKGLSVMVRVNIDKTNIQYLEKLFQQLEEEGILHRVALSFGAILEFGNVCRSVEDTLIEPEEAEQIFAQEKMKSILRKSKGYARRMFPSLGGCVATAENSIIVGPSGELYKCSKTIGSEDEIFGHISNIDKEVPNFRKWQSFDNLNDDTCKKCSVLPLCYGSACAFEFAVKGRVGMSCDSFKFKNGYIENLKELYQSNKER